MFPEFQGEKLSIDRMTYLFTKGEAGKGEAGRSFKI